MTRQDKGENSSSTKSGGSQHLRYQPNAIASKLNNLTAEQAVHPLKCRMNGMLH